MTATPITSDQRKHYERFMGDLVEAALCETKADKDDLQRFFARGGEFQAYFVAGVRRFMAKAPDYELARVLQLPNPRHGGQATVRRATV